MTTTTTSEKKLSILWLVHEPKTKPWAFPLSAAFTRQFTASYLGDPKVKTEPRCVWRPPEAHQSHVASRPGTTTAGNIWKKNFWRGDRQTNQTHDWWRLALTSYLLRAYAAFATQENFAMQVILTENMNAMTLVSSVSCEEFLVEFQIRGQISLSLPL